MKLRLIALASLIVLVSLSSCLRDDCSSEMTFQRYDPVYKAISEFRVEVKAESPRALKEPGKIYALGHYLLINEKQTGIHVFDNTDPANPTPVVFWNIPGNVDMAIQGQYLYADQYVDLVTIDISDIQHPFIVCRAENTFPMYGFDPEKGFLVDYAKTSVTETVNCGDNRWGTPWYYEGDIIFVSGQFDATSSGGGGSSIPGSVGIAGSFARFGLADGFLFTVDNWLLRSWALSDPSCPVRADSAWLGWNAETIFPWKDRLFIGSQNGLFVFDHSIPGHPVLEATFSHATGCDPVVCDENNAYVTIHDGTNCNGTFNQLDIIDIENLPSASLLKSYQMKRPFGLSVTNDHLFLCDDGLKIFDKTNPLELKELAHVKNIDTYDVIAFSDSHLLLVGADGFFQFDVSDPTNPKQISLIPVLR